MKLRLAHKLLIVLAVPVAFQLVFFSAVQSTLRELDQVQQLEHQSTDALILRDHLYVDFYQRILLYALYRATKDEKYHEQYDQLGDRVAEEYKEVRAFFANDPQKLPAIKAMGRGLKSFSWLTDFMMNNDVSDTHISSMLDGELGMSIMRVALDANNSADVELMIQSMTYEQEMLDARTIAAARSLNNLLLFGGLFSIGATLACGLFLSKSITERLRKVVLNIRAMQRREPVVEVFGSTRGGDEIAHLDEAVVATAKQIRSAELFQAQTTQLVANELERPLQDIATALQELRTSGFENLTAKGESRFDLVSDEVVRLRALVDDLTILDSIREAGYDVTPRSIELQQVAERAASIVRESASARNISIELRAESGAVHADFERAVQVAVNLLSNAIKFSPQNSTIELRVEFEHGSGKLSVKDVGPGIPDEFKSRIFSRFEQSELGGGTQASSGLGLAISKKLIEAQGGRMSFESEVGRGSTFWFTLPCSEPQVTAPSLSPDSAEAREWKPQLRRQLFALIAIPLLVQVVTVASLAFIANSSRTNLDEFARTRRVVQVHTDLVRQIVRSTFFAMIYNVSKKPLDHDLAIIERTRVENLVRQLEQYSAPSPVLSADTGSLKTAVNRISKMQAEIMNAEQDVDLKRWFGPEVAQQNEALLTDAMIPVENALQHQRDLLDSRAASQAAIRGGLQLVMIISTFLSAAVSIGFGLYMMRRVSTRTKVLVSNTVHLQKREPLAKPLSGVDELAYIDTAFHEAAEKLTELERFKQEMVSVTSHELRAPLTSLLAFSDLAGSGVFGALTDRGEQLLRKARRCASDLIALITDLLDSEKMQAGKQLVMPKQTKLDEVVSQATAQLQDFTDDKKIHLECNVTPLEVKADGERVAQALKAIVRDATEYVPVDSTIKIDATSNQLRIAVPATNEAPTARTRLSISLSELVAQQHGGHFQITENESGQIFIFDLPANDR